MLGKRLLFAISLLLAAATPYLCIAETIIFFPDSTHGETIRINYTFESGSGSSGYFVNGPNEPWVADSAGGHITIIDIDPEPLDPCEVYCDIDPTAGYYPATGFNSHFMRYSAAENALANFDSTNPATHVKVEAGQTAVFAIGATRGIPQYAGGHLHWLKAYCPLTVLAAAPSPATDGYWFRPFWGGGGAPKVPEYNTADIDLDVFPDLAAVAGSPDAGALLDELQRMACDWQFHYENEYTHSVYGPSHYGCATALVTSKAFLWLCESHTDGEKLPMAASLIQYGLDCSRAIQYGTTSRGYPPLDSTWGSIGGWGGHMVGRFLPVVAVARCLGDSLATSQLAHSGNDHVDQYPYPSDAVGFAESVQVHRLNATGYPLTTLQRSTLSTYPAVDIWGPPYNYTAGKAMFYWVTSSAPYGGYPITAGTALFTHDSTAVVGTGTAWTTASNGHMIMCRPDYVGSYPKTDGSEMESPSGRAYTIQSVADANHLTLARAWTGATDTYLYGIANFVGLDRCDQATSPFEDYNEPTVADVGMLMFQQGGAGCPSNVGLKFPRMYGDITGAAMVTSALGLLMTGSQTLGQWDDLLDYGDSWMYQWGEHELPGYWIEWFRTVYDEYRDDYASTWPIWKPFAPNAGSDQIVMWENKGHVHLVGTARNLLVNRIAAAPVYTWTDSESNVVGTGLTPDAIALPAAGSYTYTLTGVATEHDYIAEPDVHRDFTETDTVTITVRPQVKFLVRRKTE